MHPELLSLQRFLLSHLFALSFLLLPFPLYLILTPYVCSVSALERHTLPFGTVLSSADSSVLVLTDSVGETTTAGWVLLQARYTIRLQRCWRILH